MKNKTTKILLSLSLISTFGSTPLAKEATQSPISANISVVSDYVWRGLTQTDGEGAIQGGFDYTHENGFAAGVWGSNVDFATNPDTSAEFDFYATYSGEVDKFGYEVGYIAYRYPSESSINFEELYLGVSYMDFGLTYYAGLGDFSDGAKVLDYAELSYNTTLSEVDFSILYGDYEDSYTVYGFGIGKSFGGVDFAINYTNTNPDDSGSGETNTVFSIGKAF